MAANWILGQWEGLASKEVYQQLKVMDCNISTCSKDRRLHRQVRCLAGGEGGTCGCKGRRSLHRQPAHAEVWNTDKIRVKRNLILSIHEVFLRIPNLHWIALDGIICGSTKVLQKKQMLCKSESMKCQNGDILFLTVLLYLFVWCMLSYSGHFSKKLALWRIINTGRITHYSCIVWCSRSKLYHMI